MSNNVASAWCDYWKLFDELVALVELNDLIRDTTINFRMEE